MADREAVLKEIVERHFGADSRDLHHALAVAREAWDAALEHAIELDRANQYPTYDDFAAALRGQKNGGKS